MKNSIYFKRLLSEFEKSSIRNRSALFQRMKKNAKTFADWYSIHRYGDNANQYVALEKMKKLVLKEKNVLEIQRNILNLFEMMTDREEQEKILKSYYGSHAEKDDLLFVLSVSTTTNGIWDEVTNLALKYYSSPGHLLAGIKARQNKNVKIMCS